MADKTRIYSIRRAGTVVALVKASNKSQALAHQARESWQVNVATPDELISATQAGIRVADAAANEPTIEPQALDA